MNSDHAARIALRLPAIPLVYRLRHTSKVPDAVVARVSIDVVDNVWIYPIDHFPNDTVGAEPSAVYAAAQISPVLNNSGERRAARIPVRDTTCLGVVLVSGEQP